MHEYRTYLAYPFTDLRFKPGTLLLARNNFYIVLNCGTVNYFRLKVLEDQ